jgi:hypothetical protein
MANTNQFGVLTINNESGGMLSSSVISFNRGTKSVTAVITCQGDYTDKSPVFDFFLQQKTATVQLVFVNTINADGETQRTITFQNAVCKDYLEDYDREKEFNEFTDIQIAFTIEADAVSMGEKDFPK